MAPHRGASLLLLCAALLAPLAADALPATSRIASALPKVAAAYAALNATTPQRLAEIEANSTNQDYLVIKETDSGGSYVAASCWALFKLMLHVDGRMAAPGSKFKKVEVDLPCGPGSVTPRGGGGGSWGAPSYGDCYYGNITELNATSGWLSLKFTPPKELAGASLTLRALRSGPGACAGEFESPGAPRTTTLGGGAVGAAGAQLAAAAAAEVPLLLLMGDPSPDAKGRPSKPSKWPSVALEGVSLDGGGLRPGLSAAYVKKVSLSELDVANFKGRGSGAAIELVDTAAAFRCKAKRPCKVRDSVTAAAPIEIPSGGGALSIRLQTIGGAGLYRSDWVDYENNTHGLLGGPLFVWKSSLQAATVTIARGRITGNRAPYCATGATFKDDGRIDMSKTKTSVPGKKLTIIIKSRGKELSTWWSDNRPPPGTAVHPLYSNLLFCGAVEHWVWHPLYTGYRLAQPYNIAWKTEVRDYSLWSDGFVYNSIDWPYNINWQPEYGYYAEANGTVVRVEMGAAAAAAVAAAKAAGLPAPREWDPSSAALL
ncbi:MAG: hypothetical protein J3K34DRAFT_412089 [Monoraphidium minutum]|nr:MAG: hypothetical protein J3K34DRAFT_412089 [Monoraphidium minutum]